MDRAEIREKVWKVSAMKTQLFRRANKVGGSAAEKATVDVERD